MTNPWTRTLQALGRQTYCDVCGYDLVQRSRNQVILFRGVG